MRSGWASVWALASALALGACEDDEPPASRFYCYEYVPGEVINPDLGVTAESRVVAQAAGDFSVAAGTASIELAAACASIAAELGAGHDVIDAALTKANLDARTVDICAVAVDAIKRDGSSRLTTPPPTCTTSDALVHACMKQCMPANDDCPTACQASATASAACPTPADARFGRVLALRARAALMSESVEKLTAAENRNTAIKAACIPRIVYSTTRAGGTLTTVRDAADKVIAAAKGP